MRLQVLYLPGTEDEQPFAVVIDEVSAEQAGGLGPVEGMAEKLGAKAVLVFSETVEVL